MDQGQPRVALHADHDSSLLQSTPAQWAIGHLRTALSARGIGVVEDGRAAEITVQILAADSREAASRAATAGVTVPDAPESFVLFRLGENIVAIGKDERGLVYALTELADRVTYGAGPLFGSVFPVAEGPATRVRSITRIFASEKEDKAWFHDKSHWISYLDMLASNRFNRFSLTFGIQYDYPYHNHIISDVYLHFPYPYLVAVPGYGIKVAELPDAERDTNLEMLRFIGTEAARRGLDFQLGLWTQRYDFDDVPNASYTIVGATDENIAPYCRDAIAMLLKAVPEITGLTFRIHVEGGVSEGDYDFWRTAFDGVRSAGRPIEIDMHAKGLDETTLNVALETGMPVAASPKYLAEHVGLSYQTSAIREREYPPKEEMTNREKLSVGSRRFLRQSYGDLLPKNKRWKVIFRVWPGTQRVLAWGDPELAAGYGRSASFCGADGIEWMEPMTFKGRQGTGISGGRVGYNSFELATRYDWQKYAYQYRLWGRLSFCPETHADSWLRYLQTQCGDAAEHVATALAAASKVLPLVTQTHGPSIANNAYWPEVYTNLRLLEDNLKRPFGFDMDAPIRFGNAPTFDPQFFANAREYVEALLEDQPLRRYSPLDVADWLERSAETAEFAAVKAKTTRDLNKPAVQRLLIDAQVAAALGRYFAAKYRGACWAEVYIASYLREAQLEAVDQMKRARAAWTQVVKLTEDVYQKDLTFGPGPHLRGNWSSRLADIDRELKDLATHQPRGETQAAVGLDRAREAMAKLASRQPTKAVAFSISAPKQFEGGEPVTISIAGRSAAGDALVLHYRHVNQAERWQAMPMTASAGAHTATIPSNYTRSPFHLQYAVSELAGTELILSPGMATSLASAPYHVIEQV